MTEHHLDNVRGVPNWDADPTCHHCGDELWEADLYEMITPRKGMTFCNEVCYDEWIIEYGGPNPRKIDPLRVDAAALYAAKAARDAEVAAHNKQVLADTLAWRAQNHGSSSGKSVARQTGEAAANVVGFLVWLVVIGAIAAVIFAVTGISSL